MTNDETHDEQGGAPARGLPRASSDDQAPATPRPAPVRPATGVGAVARCPGRAPALHTYEVWVKGWDGRTVVLARTAGQAKAVHWRDVGDDCGIPFVALRVRRVLDAEPTGFRRCADSRGFAWVRAGQRVVVCGKPGVIVGHNSSANWNVLFDGGNDVLNCHPRSEIAYYDDAGGLVESYDIRGQRTAGEVPRGH